MSDKLTKTDAEWREALPADVYAVTRKHGTERPWSGKYNDEKRKGVYACACCGQELFHSDTKYESGSGWPSYWQPISPDRVTLHKDTSYGMVRVEVLCSKCDAHLGHVFPDGPPPTGERYCMNSVALDLKPDE
ncbi:MAG: peptide-methionine (R)-S-oxide reductase MsrB [Alphaproteobacteria bacterium]|nr:peptide-methionine (R)-S-oxide reductase MsrB [Alphaproteobacteria bacterium]MCB9928694.1 peptide-methionine (R)-S-oxide reductase MsrB [Alphaproteobacteria bacterium]